MSVLEDGRGKNKRENGILIQCLSCGRPQEYKQKRGNL